MATTKKRTLSDLKMEHRLASKNKMRLEIVVGALELVQVLHPKMMKMLANTCRTAYRKLQETSKTI